MNKLIQRKERKPQMVVIKMTKKLTKKQTLILLLAQIPNLMIKLLLAFQIFKNVFKERKIL